MPIVAMAPAMAIRAMPLTVIVLSRPTVSSISSHVASLRSAAAVCPCVALTMLEG